MKRNSWDWSIRGRPVGEWLYLTVMVLLAINALHNGLTNAFHGIRQLMVQAGNVVLGLSGFGIAFATVTGRRIGIRLLWLWAATIAFTGPMAAWSYGDASVGTALIALGSMVLVGAGVITYGTRRLHASISQREWPRVLADHAAAADEFVAAIERLSPEQWITRSSPEAWSAAEITDHLARTYSQFAGEARGKNSLRIRLGLVRRTLARIIVKPRLLAGASFPKARAPRELRPSSGPATPADGVALFRATGEACLRDLEILVQRRPYRQLVHPMLGPLPLYELLPFAAQHVRHHRRQLPS